VTSRIEVLITRVTNMRYEGGVRKRPWQLADMHVSRPGTRSMVRRPRTRCECTCDPVDPTFWAIFVTGLVGVTSRYNPLERLSAFSDKLLASAHDV